MYDQKAKVARTNINSNEVNSNIRYNRNYYLQLQVKSTNIWSNNKSARDSYESKVRLEWSIF